MKFERYALALVAALAALALVACGDAQQDDVAPGGGIRPGTAGENTGVEGDVEGSVEEGGELGDVEVTAEVGGIEPTAQLATPDTVGGEGGPTIGGEEAPLVVGQVEENAIQFEDDASPPYVTFNTIEALLRERGAAVEELGEVAGAAFALTSKRLSVNGEEVLVFEFPSTREAQDAAAAMAVGEMDADLSTLLAAGRAVFQEGNVVALYTGSDEQVDGLLAALFGEPLPAG